MPVKKYFTKEEKQQAKRNYDNRRYAKDVVYRKMKLEDRKLRYKTKLETLSEKEKEDFRLNSIQRAKKYRLKACSSPEGHEKYNRMALKRANKHYAKNRVIIIQKGKEDRSEISSNYVKSLISDTYNIKVKDIPSDPKLLELKKISILAYRLIKQSKQNEQEKVV